MVDFKLMIDDRYPKLQFLCDPVTIKIIYWRNWVTSSDEINKIRTSMSYWDDWKASSSMTATIDMSQAVCLKDVTIEDVITNNLKDEI